MAETDDEKSLKELTQALAAEADQPNIRALKVVVIVLGVLILFGLVGLGFGLVWRAGQGSGPAARAAGPAPPPPGAPTPSLQLTLPPQARIIDMAYSGERVVFRIGLPDGREQLLFFDPKSGGITSTVDVQTAR